MHTPVLVDTSVFVDFFRKSGACNDALRDLLEEGRVLLSQFVRLELLAGMKLRERKQVSTLLDALEVVAVNTELLGAAELLLPTVRAKGFNAGLVDYLIVVQAVSGGVALFTRDAVMGKVARVLGAELV